MPILPDDYIDPELQDLVGGGSMAEVAKSLRATPELLIKENPLVELPSGKGLTDTAETKTEISTVQLVDEALGFSGEDASRVASECTLGQKATQATAHIALSKSPHRPALKMLLEITRKSTALRKIRTSDGWDRLLDSMTIYVEEQVAAGRA